MTEESGSESGDLETKIVDVMSSNPKGVSNSTLLQSIPSMTNRSMVDILNKLLGQNKIEIFKKGKQLVYKLKNSTSGQFQGADIEEKVIFEAIERAGNNGMTAKDLRFKCNLHAKPVNDILKKLESKKLIKCITPAPRKKFYLLYDLEPSSEITGGTFCRGEDFETEFVDTLGDQCYKYLLLQAKVAAESSLDPILQRNASYKSSKDILDYINNLKISKVILSMQDIEHILEALVYDEKIEKCVSVTKTHSSTGKSDTENLYRVTKPLISSAALMRMPCGVCLVYQDCHVGGEISPSTCVYMKEWLEF